MCQLAVPAYDLLLSSDTLQKIVDYQELLSIDSTKAGKYLKRQLKDETVSDLTSEQFIGALLKTKKACIFAENELECDGSDWSPDEVSILGDICVAIEVKVFDNGVWSSGDPQFSPHEVPFLAHLIFVPGALLSNGASPDLTEVREDNVISYEKYSVLMKRRLVPVLDFINSKSTDKPAIITIPGIGCGLFAGQFVNVIPSYLEQTLQEILQANHDRYANIQCVVFDPYEGETSSTSMGHISFRVRPYLKHLKSQLGTPSSFEELKDDFSSLSLFKIVAWDHLSLPGNDYFQGSRHTDDGVTSAATDCMSRLTGVKGVYDGKGRYLPPSEFRCWEEVAKAHKIHLYVHRNLRVSIDL